MGGRASSVVVKRDRATFQRDSAAFLPFFLCCPFLPSPLPAPVDTCRRPLHKLATFQQYRDSPCPPHPPSFAMSLSTSPPLSLGWDRYPSKEAIWKLTPLEGERYVCFRYEFSVTGKSLLTSALFPVKGHFRPLFHSPAVSHALSRRRIIRPTALLVPLRPSLSRRRLRRFRFVRFLLSTLFRTYESKVDGADLSSHSQRRDDNDLRLKPPSTLFLHEHSSFFLPRCCTVASTGLPACCDQYTFPHSSALVPLDCFAR